MSALKKFSMMKIISRNTFHLHQLSRRYGVQGANNKPKRAIYACPVINEPTPQTNTHTARTEQLFPRGNHGSGYTDVHVLEFESFLVMKAALCLRSHLVEHDGRAGRQRSRSAALHTLPSSGSGEWVTPAANGSDRAQLTIRRCLSLYYEVESCDHIRDLMSLSQIGV